MAYNSYYVQPQSNFIWNHVELLFYVLVIGGAIAWYWWNKRQLAKIVVDAPLLLALYTMGNTLTKMSDGALGEYHYDLMITEPIQIEMPENPTHYTGNAGLIGVAAADVAIYDHNVSNSGKIIMTMQLPVKSSVHIAGLGIPDDKTQALFNGQLSACNLEPAELEGDFPDYFKLYCNKGGHQIELREVLDPATMAFLVDFCSREDWELFEDMIYFSQNNVSKKQPETPDHTTVVEDAQLFINRALPVLQRMNKFSSLTEPSN